MDSHLYNATHPSIAPSLLSSAAVLSSLLLYHIAANPEEDGNVAAIAVDLDELWTISLQFYTMYSVTQVWLSSNFLFHFTWQSFTRISTRWFLFQNGFLWASVIPSTLERDPSTSPGMFSESTLSGFDYSLGNTSTPFYLVLTFSHRSQHSRLADLPHLSPVVVKFAHLTCSQACCLDT